MNQEARSTGRGYFRLSENRGSKILIQADKDAKKVLLQIIGRNEKEMWKIEKV